MIIRALRYSLWFEYVCVFVLLFSTVASLVISIFGLVPFEHPEHKILATVFFALFSVVMTGVFYSELKNPINISFDESKSAFIESAIFPYSLSPTNIKEISCSLEGDWRIIHAGGAVNLRHFKEKNLMYFFKYLIGENPSIYFPKKSFEYTANLYD